MKIDIIGPVYPLRGGASHYTKFLTDELKKRGHEYDSISFKRWIPSFLHPAETQEDSESKKSLAVESEYLLDTLNPLSWIRTSIRVIKNKPDFVFIHWWSPLTAPLFFTLGFLIRYFSNIKIVFILHALLPHHKTFLDIPLLKLTFRTGHYFMSHSKRDTQILKEIKPNANVIEAFLPTYTGISSGNFTKNNSKKKLGLKNKTILFFGFVRQYKGLMYLLEAMPKILEKYKCTLLIAGDFYEDKEKYIKKIKELEIQKNVKIIDKYIPNEEVGTYFSASDVVVLPYLYTSQSGVAQIAYGFNKPVITTDVGGLPDVIIHNKTGIITPPADARAIANAVIDYYKYNKEKKFENNIKVHKRKYSWKNLVKKIEKIYKGIANEEN